MSVTSRSRSPTCSATCMFHASEVLHSYTMLHHILFRVMSQNSIWNSEQSGLNGCLCHMPQQVKLFYFSTTKSIRPLISKSCPAPQRVPRPSTKLNATIKPLSKRITDSQVSAHITHLICNKAIRKLTNRGTHGKLHHLCAQNQDRL